VGRACLRDHLCTVNAVSGSEAVPSVNVASGSGSAVSTDTIEFGGLD
jgi:hypothetical protein